MATDSNGNYVFTAKDLVAWVSGVAATLFIVLVLIVGSLAMFGSVGRWQHRQNANNAVKVSAIEIRNQAQRIQVAQQKAQIRFEDSKGVREAQDEIAKTLTPLYVQFEMVDALRQIAQSGRNNTVVYVPSGANGIPLVSTTDPTKVGQPDSSGK